MSAVKRTAWRLNASRESVQAAVAAEPDDLERLEREYQAERATAVRALQAANAAIQAGKANDSKLFITSHGIARDRARDRQAQVHAAREHQARLSEEQAQIVVRGGGRLAARPGARAAGRAELAGQERAGPPFA
jgi:hypothetical protein